MEPERGGPKACGENNAFPVSFATVFLMAPSGCGSAELEPPALGAVVVSRDGEVRLAGSGESKVAATHATPCPTVSFTLPTCWATRPARGRATRQAISTRDTWWLPRCMEEVLAVHLASKGEGGH